MPEAGMKVKISAVAAVLVLGLSVAAPATAAMYVIENPAGNLSNPADKMYNPAAKTSNPASSIDNPGSRVNNRNPLTAPNPVPEPAAKGTAPAAAPAQVKVPGQYQQQIPQTKYYFKTVGAYIQAAKKAFVNDNYPEFLSLTEDALRRINAGTLKASAKSRHILQKYKVFGYGLLENNTQ